ncbi:hypothetical protein [Blackfly microvirus SF02]|uniref:Uncharacterized protein n=1 Tax=Blackfly microvirus SF02 TaxID=2576452 RepID=A0A4P8PJJ6_9VIRU|nr:hypothetical protein [Blackfly microvirus SF02]
MCAKRGGSSLIFWRASFFWHGTCSFFSLSTCEAARQRSAPEHVTLFFDCVQSFYVCSCMFLFCSCFGVWGLLFLAGKAPVFFVVMFLFLFVFFCFFFPFFLSFFLSSPLC